MTVESGPDSHAKVNGTDTPCCSNSSAGVDNASRGCAATSVIIVGGGLAGLSSALALLKKGIKVQVFDRSVGSTAKPAGTLISLAPNGLQALDTINSRVVEKIKSRGAAPSVSYLAAPNGDVIKEGPWPLKGEYKHRTICIRWSRILDSLKEELPEGVLQLGWTFKGATQDEDSVTAEFARGDEVQIVTADLLIGSDGIRSVVRESVLGFGKARDLGRVAWRAVIPRTEGLTSKFKRQAAWTALGEGQTCMVLDPGEEHMYWCCTLLDTAADGTGKVRSNDNDEAKRRLLQLYADWGCFKEVLEATEPELILERRIMDLPELEKWSEGRVVVIGDAAHAIPPAMGQGANLSFEDSLELARQLSAHTNVKDALRSFEGERIERVARVAYQNSTNASMAYKEKKWAPMSTDFLTFLHGYDRNALAL